jgi:hypothetical protein
MKVSDLIKELQSCDPNMDIDVVVSITEHYCGPNSYCYCSAEDKHCYITGVSKRTEYDKKGRKQIVNGYSIIGDY